MEQKNNKDHIHNPTVSVVMSVYNDANYIRDAIESILVQSFNDFEFIIVDDASNDGSTLIIEEYARKDHRVRVYRNDSNKGLTKNLNFGLSKSRGEFIARMDGDDIASPHRFEEQISFLRENPDVVLVGSWTTNIDSQSKKISVSQAPTSSHVFRWSSVFRATLAHPTAMFRKQTIEEHSLRYNESLRTSQDYDFWSNLLVYGEAAILPKYLLQYRQHSHNVSSQRRAEQAANSVQTCFNNLNDLKSNYAQCQASQENLLALSQFIYGCNAQDNIDPKKLLATMFSIQHYFLLNENVNESEKAEIEKLTIRWLLQSIFIKQKMKFFVRLEFVARLLPKTNVILSELKDISKRHFA